MQSHEHIDTLVIGAGQAGLSTSYWLRQAGVPHLVVDGRPELGGGWHDRWDSFHLVAPNYTLLLPGMAYTGPEPDGFMPRAGVIDYVARYAKTIDAPVRLGTRITRLERTQGGARFAAHAAAAVFHARNVVLATGGYQRPKLPAAAADVAPHIRRLHSHDYRRPAQLAPGGVLVVGSGQSGTQIAEELQAAGREVHLAVSRCGSAPRRYRGRDVIWWLLHSFLEGERFGVHFPTVDDLPSPADRFACDPHLSGVGGGHDIDLRDFARRGIRLYGRLEAAAGTRVRFSDDLAERLAFADTWFDGELKPLFDAFIEAAGIPASPDDRPAHGTYVPDTAREIDLDAAGIASVLFATGYEFAFDWVKLPIFDEWGYPRHARGVTVEPGLYAVGLRWLYSEPSSVFAGVGADAAHIVEHLVARSGGARTAAAL